MEHMAGEYLRFYAGAPPVEARAGGADQPQGWSDPRSAPGLSCELGRPSSSLLH